MKTLASITILLFLAFPGLSQERSWGIATTNNLGVVQPDGITVVITNGVISSLGGGGGGGSGIQTNGGTGINNTFSNLTEIGANDTGNFHGTFQMTNGGFVTGSARGVSIGFNNQPGIYDFGSASGQETVIYNGPSSAGLGNGFYEENTFPLFQFDQSGDGGQPNNLDRAFYFKLFLGTTALSVNGTQNYGNAGALQTSFSPFSGGSAAPMYDLSSADAGNSIHKGMQHPWIGVITDDTRASQSSPGPLITNVMFITNLSVYFRTSAIAGQFQHFGFDPVFLADDGWEQTNRDSFGYLQPFPGIFPGGVSNVMYIAHTNGMQVVFAMYQDNHIPVQANSDTAVRCDISGANLNTYPSLASGGPYVSPAVAYTFPVMTPDTTYKDMIWFYTNGLDGIFSQDVFFFSVQGAEHERSAALADAILYPFTTLDGRVYWQNWTNVGSGNTGPIGSTIFGQGSQLSHQLWSGMFFNHPGPETPYYCNFFTADQSPGTTAGFDATIGLAMDYVRGYNERMSNYMTAGCFPFMSESHIASESSLTAANFTNWYSVVGEFNACSTSTMYTNTSPFTQSWNTNQNIVVTNYNFLAAQQDVQPWPTRVFDDGTNSLWIRPATNGGFYLLAVNQSAGNSNFNVALPLLSPGAVYAATNIFSGQALGNGLLQTNFVSTVSASSVQWIRLTPYGFYIPTTSGPFVTISNIPSVVSGGHYTNVMPYRVKVFGGAICVAGASSVGGSANSSTFMFEPSINGALQNTGAPMGGIALQSVGTNTAWTSVSADLGPGDWFTVSSTTVGAQSAITYHDFYFQ